MAKEKKSALKAPRANLFMLDPDEVVVVEDEGHFLYDPRVKLPLEEAMVRSIMAFGVKSPITVCKDGDQVLVVAGRRRVKHARVANERLKAEGKEPVRVPARVERGAEGDLFGVSIIENELRRDDSPIVKARKAQRLLGMGKSEQEVMVTLGVKKSTFQTYMALLDASSTLQRAVESGAVPASAALEIAKLPRDEQEAALAEVKSSAAAPGGGSSTSRAREVVAKKRGVEVVVRPSLTAIREARDAADTGTPIHAALSWVLGERKTLEV